ncbi:2-dehydropantoate 2-reductase [Salinisphaera shabanensis T35B1]|uniref:ketopantoate reductase family protein n=1 Tax=Salinisphaera shabanensis TaxID=180542 RepID=UPI003341D7C7
MPRWFLTGAGHIGTLAAYYLTRAGHDVTVLRNEAGAAIDATLQFASDASTRRLTLPVRTPSTCDRPIEYLIVACKTPYTPAALTRLDLGPNATVLRLQNGIGSLDRLLPDGARLIETVTTNAVNGTRNVHRVVAENQTWMGDGNTKPAWFDELARCWPGLVWERDIRTAQWRKLVANAAINALTALHDVPNGALLDDAQLYAQMRAIVAETDQVLAALDEDWKASSLAAVETVVQATAANTSSMRADMQHGAVTEIDAINGWLVEQGTRLGLDMIVNKTLVERVRALAPTRGSGE